MDTFPRLVSLSSGTAETVKDLGKDLVRGGPGGPGAGARVEVAVTPAEDVPRDEDGPGTVGWEGREEMVS